MMSKHSSQNDAIHLPHISYLMCVSLLNMLEMWDQHLLLPNSLVGFCLHHKNSFANDVKNLYEPRFGLSDIFKNSWKTNQLKQHKNRLRRYNTIFATYKITSVSDLRESKLIKQNQRDLSDHIDNWKF
ncbi:hypothetical protein BpHYR1_023988 [Brachionus plicatilis]|uniref:Uncharacterized protein n=1 Tax=Brachionus plicatilis TaxID=10195 RepID=A0A3M7SHC1_BRAPC|nr:hypothetical protein BpHYR1_023988 [Brachionus plicatilis]